MSVLQCLTGFNKPWEPTRKDSGSITSQIELIKAQVLNRLADAAEPFVQVMVDNGTGVKEFESATFGMLLKVGLQLVKRFGQIQSDGDRGETIIDSVPAPDGLAPSELQVRSYTTPPTPQQPPTGLRRRS